MKYLLDTCAISDFVKGEKNTLNRIKTTSPSKLATSSITLMELHYGIQCNRSIATKIAPMIYDFIDCIQIVQFDNETAEHAAHARTYLRKKGTPIGPYDILIAGTALQHQLTLITANEKEFDRVPKLKIENWRT